MHIMIKKFTGIIFIILFLTSCYLPKPVIRVKPEENQTTWENGKEFVGYRVGNFEVYVAYHGIENNLLAFDIEIINYEG